MKNEEIIKKAISKAVKNGWDIVSFYSEEIKPLDATDEWGKLDLDFTDDGFCHDNDTGELLVWLGGLGTFLVEKNTIIFSKSWAKAFWGEGRHEKDGTLTCRFCGAYINWQDSPYCYDYHLQQLAILDDDERIKYIGRFL